MVSVNHKIRIIIIIIIIITIIIIIIISFMRGIYTYIREKNYVPREYSVAAILLLLLLLLLSSFLLMCCTKVKRVAKQTA